MSAVFEFDDEALRRNSVDSLKHDDAADIPAEVDESGYSSEIDAAEPTPIPADERLYEVALGKNYISSSVKDSSAPAKRICIDDFEILKLLGRGAYGKVMLCRHKQSQQLYAMKVLKKASLFVHAKNAEHTKAERQILEEVRHPFIVQLMYAFQTQDRLYLILQYAVGGELFTQMAAEQMFSENAARFYIAELVLALEHLHKLGIVYRDLKPENCMLDADGHILLTDFGLSKVALDGKANTLCGTAEYMAPEVLMGMHYDKSVDWWTLGILMYEMLTGSTPFRSSNKAKTFQAIKQKKLHVPYYLSSDASNLLHQLLRKNPNSRLGSTEDGSERVKSHRWFRKIDWDSVLKRQMTPPIIPVVTDPALAENFDEQFTKEEIKETPVEGSVDPTMMREYFENFSYVAQSHLSTLK
ncbi:hypothetical protein VTP01DRAFT_6852 [Rhizomucor pusillus]|uniref:uncharacterized protein n=1 Tax=Rhizomucor pusillus TaxID=4840 RepID=UPI003744986B